MLVVQALSLRRAATRLAAVVVVQGQRVLTAPQATSAGTVVQGLLHLLQAARLSEPVVAVALAHQPPEPHQVVGVQAQHPVLQHPARQTPEAGAAQVATARAALAVAES
jgi:hypothetical protein